MAPLSTHVEPFERQIFVWRTVWHPHGERRDARIEKESGRSRGTSFCFQVLVFGFKRVGQKMFETKYGSTAWVKRRFDMGTSLRVKPKNNHIDITRRARVESTNYRGRRASAREVVVGSITGHHVESDGAPLAGAWGGARVGARVAREEAPARG